MHPSIKSVTFTPTGKTAEDLAAIRAKPPTFSLWEVKRSGPALTLEGFVNMKPAKLAGMSRIKQINPDDGTARVNVALDREGTILAYLN